MLGISETSFEIQSERASETFVADWIGESTYVCAPSVSLVRGALVEQILPSGARQSFVVKEAVPDPIMGWLRFKVDDNDIGQIPSTKNLQLEWERIAGQLSDRLRSDFVTAISEAINRVERRASIDIDALADSLVTKLSKKDRGLLKRQIEPVLQNLGAGAIYDVLKMIVSLLT